MKKLERQALVKKWGKENELLLPIEIHVQRIIQKGKFRGTQETKISKGFQTEIQISDKENRNYYEVNKEGVRQRFVCESIKRDKYEIVVIK